MVMDMEILSSFIYIKIVRRAEIVGVVRKTSSIDGAN